MGAGRIPLAWFRKVNRGRGLRRRYRQLLRAVPDSAPERVSFHLRQLDEYWDRALGFLKMTPMTASFVDSDFVQCIEVATREADPDVLAWVPTGGHSIAWQSYAKAVGGIRRGPTDTATRLRDAHDRFVAILSLGPGQ